MFRSTNINKFTYVSRTDNRAYHLIGVFVLFFPQSFDRHRSSNTDVHFTQLYK